MQSSILPSAVGFLCPSHSAVCTIVHLCLHVHVFHNVAFTATSLDYHCSILRYFSVFAVLKFYSHMNYFSNRVSFSYCRYAPFSISRFFLWLDYNAAEKTALKLWRQLVQAIA